MPIWVPSNANRQVRQRYGSGRLVVARRRPKFPSHQARRFSCSRELICDIRIGPRENFPASAFRVNPRR